MIPVLLISRPEISGHLGKPLWLQRHLKAKKDTGYVWGNHANWEYIGLSCLQERNPHNSDEGWTWILYALNFSSKHGRLNFILCWARIAKCLRSPATLAALASLCGCKIWRPQRCNKFLYNACGLEVLMGSRASWAGRMAPAPLEGGEVQGPVEYSKRILRLGWKLKTISYRIQDWFFLWVLFRF